MTPNHGGPLPALSFVVPALNEAAMLPELFRSIEDFVPAVVTHEVIVVDNGSSDSTVEVASAAGARVLSAPHASLGALRNKGVRAARGDILVFLDADVRLTPEWGSRIRSVLDALRDDPDRITGSWCRPSPDASWVAKAWMDVDRRRRAVSHLGSGHMLVPRATFGRVGGFDETLATGEDFEFCRRAVAQGIHIGPEADLTAVHVRLPNSVGNFFRRELWHGSGDWASFLAPLRSRVLAVAAGFALLHVLVTASAGVGSSRLAVVGVGGIVGLCAMGAARRGGLAIDATFVQRTLLVYVFLWARFLGWIRHFQRGHRGRGW